MGNARTKPLYSLPKFTRNMIIPVRCFSCGNPRVSDTWDEYKERTKTEKAEKVLNDLEIKRYCCRAVMLGHVDLLETVAKFKKA